MTRNVLTMTALLISSLTPALAQTAPASPPSVSTVAAQPASGLAAEARALAERARATYPKGSASIDQTLWKQAAAAAEAAVSAEPTNAEYLKLRAQIYTEVGFWRQAELSWAAYFRVAPAQGVTPETRQAADVQYNLGYAAYTRNQPSEAARFFAACLQLDPASVPCTTWAARTALEAGNYAQAQTLYASALRLNPGDKTLSYFQTVAQNASRYGPAATRAFSRAYADVEAGKKAQALAGFQEAARSAPNFLEAQREAGRLALELGNAEVALAAFQKAASLPGATAADRYNLSLAQEGQQYGLEAVRTFREAYARYTAGNKAAAEQGFQAATSRNPNYAKAWAWLGRVRYEAKNFQAAAEAYGRAVQLDPGDKSSAYFLRLAQQGK
ncbi:tetratricopeptide repeat protein [Deinococcus deserti]|uniref:Putative tetratricopeptide repeat (TPR) domain protein n=1 Tax=Deinococcus deserti (strain DSM 17065 / CIP 109153 / LMG 22923 / VCD115) TaxID=546414 RepID=C1D078_DEIDV|nr:tetratricopeptide repeat protein [Deinococcus deserti]ACO47347.1 putative tetratricopeptide repeat (TPR) domain protein, precursor [Deinococcus deserti VCD115]